MRAACRTSAAPADSTSLFGFEDSRASSGLTANGLLTLRPARNMTLRLRYQYSRTSSELVPYFANRVNVSGVAGINGNDQDPRNWGPPALSFASDVAGLSTGRYASTTTQTHVWAADFSRFRGAHNVGLGIEARAVRNDVIGAAGSARHVRLHRRGHRPRLRRLPARAAADEHDRVRQPGQELPRAALFGLRDRRLDESVPD